MLTDKQYQASKQLQFKGLQLYYLDSLHGKVKRLRPLDWEHTLFNFLLTWESVVMKNSNKQNKQAASWNKIEFITRSMDETEAASFKQWVKSVDKEASTMIQDAMLDDYKLSVTWDDNNECFIATLTGKQEQRSNADKALSSRSDDWYEAIMLTLYKHHVLFNGGKWSGSSQKNNWG